MFDFKEYYNLLTAKKVKEAFQFRANNVPKTLYKYVSLSHDDCIEYKSNCSKTIRLNNSKLENLEKSAIWMSRLDSLNDPFEHKAMYLNTERLKKHNFPDEEIANIKILMNEMRKSYLISSFTTEVVNNMPMWAHYANNHQGYCIELEVLNGDLVFPVSYEVARIPVATTITRLISKMKMIENGEIKETDEDFRFYVTMFLHSAALKHKSWEYENEYRVLLPYKFQNDSGMIIPLKSQGLKIRSIFIGTDCSSDNESKLRIIANKLKIPIYKMYLSEEGKNFELDYK
ncbi:DUF2971 domain-containing protein [Fusibacter bizertensis]